MKKNEQINLNAKIVKTSGNVKLKMNNNNKIPRITGLAIDDIICKNTFFNIASGELIIIFGSASDISLVWAILVKKDASWFLTIVGFEGCWSKGSSSLGHSVNNFPLHSGILVYFDVNNNKNNNAIIYSAA